MALVEYHFHITNCQLKGRQAYDLHVVWNDILILSDRRPKFNATGRLHSHEINITCSFSYKNTYTGYQQTTATAPMKCDITRLLRQIQLGQLLYIDKSPSWMDSEVVVIHMFRQIFYVLIMRRFNQMKLSAQSSCSLHSCPDNRIRLHQFVHMNIVIRHPSLVSQTRYC